MMRLYVTCGLNRVYSAGEGFWSRKNAVLAGTPLDRPSSVGRPASGMRELTRVPKVRLMTGVLVLKPVKYAGDLNGTARLPRSALVPSPKPVSGKVQVSHHG